MRPFGEAQSKAMRAYAQSGQYHTIVESHVRLTEKKKTILIVATRGYWNLKCCELWSVYLKRSRTDMMIEIMWSVIYFKASHENQNKMSNKPLSQQNFA